MSPQMQGNYGSHIDSDHSRDTTPPQTTGNSRPQSEVFLHEKVLVVVDATKQLTKHALEWALTNVLVRPGESITLLALLPAGNYSPVRRIWGFPMSLQRLGRDCATPRTWGGAVDGSKDTKKAVEEDVRQSCSNLIQEFQELCNQKKVRVEVKLLEVNGRDATATEAMNMGATWVVLDKHLKKEGKYCMELLQCNIVIVKPSEPKILRLNLKRAPRVEIPVQVPDNSPSTTVQEVLSVSQSPPQPLPLGGVANVHPRSVGYRGPKETTSSSSPDEVMTPFTPSDPGTSSKSSSEPSTSPNKVSGPLLNSASAELGVREAILEAAAADVLVHEGTFNSDTDEGVSMAPAMTPELTSLSTIYKPKPAKALFDVRVQSPAESAKPPTGYRGGTHSKEATPQSRPASRSASRSTSRANSRRESPVKIVQRESPVKSLNGSRRESFESGLSSGRREHSLGQNLRAILQENAEMDPTPFQGGSPSGYHGDQEPGDDSPQPRLKQGKNDAYTRHKMAMMLSKHNLPGPPPLCSICQHKAPIFGKPPQRYSFAELEIATGGFSRVNFLAEGGYGSVHRGILPDGQAVAVKQYKLASTQGDKEFCAEVEVLSCAQHRNVVMLIGYCIEGKRRLLIYEFICNGSLDSHLYERNKLPLEWSSRHKIAVGAARGLRYLHEECRVGCIVHRDLRPQNILLTHDFEPMVGDFGLARWQPDGDCGVETRVIGTFGYLAPEYTQHGQITDKADVYSFGVVLLELITGRKAIDITRPKGEQCLTEWARPLLEERGNLLVDPRLDCYSEIEVDCMLHAAACCIRRDPLQRPRMAQVLRMLEGEMNFDANGSPTSAYFTGRLNCSYVGLGRHQVPGPDVREEVKYPNFASPQSDYHSNYSSPTSSLSNFIKSSPNLNLSPTSRDFNNKLVTPSIGIHSGPKLSYEALRAAYMDKGCYTHVSASAYETYQLGKDF